MIAVKPFFQLLYLSQVEITTRWKPFNYVHFLV